MKKDYDIVIIPGGPAYKKLAQVSLVLNSFVKLYKCIIQKSIYKIIIVKINFKFQSSLIKDLLKKQEDRNGIIAAICAGIRIILFAKNIHIFQCKMKKNYNNNLV